MEAKDSLKTTQSNFYMSLGPIIQVLDSLDEYLKLKRRSRDSTLDERKKVADLARNVEESISELEQLEDDLETEN